MADGTPSLSSFHDLAPVQESFHDALLSALSSEQRSLAPKFLYDEAGADLFGQITRLPEYYPTRTEIGILRQRAGEMAEAIGPNARVIEFGASASSKARILLSALERPKAYVPIDVSADHLRQAAEEIARDYPQIEVVAVCADYTQPVPLPAEVMTGEGRRVGFFPGSSIGNLEPQEAEAFLSQWRRQLGGEGAMLVGVDLRKDPETLRRAYNDAQGVTARFTLNLLARANRELGTDFDLSAFAHDAEWQDTESRISINLKSLKDQQVRLDGRAFDLAAGERIHTEYSYKYTVEGFADLARRAGFEPRRVWTDDARMFSVHYLEVAA
jgi:dimethylhistidine N-methyltransferase